MADGRKVKEYDVANWVCLKKEPEDEFMMSPVKGGVVKIPKYADILSVKVVGHRIRLFAAVNESMPIEKRHFVVVGSEDSFKYRGTGYVGTVVVLDKGFHVFENPVEQRESERNPEHDDD